MIRLAAQCWPVYGILGEGLNRTLNPRERSSYPLCYAARMAETITFRPDEDARRALAVLTQDGTAVSTAVRDALIAAARVRAQQRLRAEAAALAADEEDRAEAAQVLRDMETLRAW